MWEKLLGINSFVLWPATGILLVYAIGRAFIFGELMLLGISVGLFALAIVVQVILGVLSD